MDGWMDCFSQYTFMPLDVKISKIELLTVYSHVVSRYQCSVNKAVVHIALWDIQDCDVH